jgi:hypothetical protein
MKPETAIEIIKQSNLNTDAKRVALLALEKEVQGELKNFLYDMFSMQQELNCRCGVDTVNIGMSEKEEAINHWTLQYTRVCVVGDNGRICDLYDLTKVELSDQDNGKTLKIFVSTK